MATSFLTQIRQIKNQINDLTIDEQKAKDFEGLLKEAIALIEKLPSPPNDFYLPRRKEVLHLLGQEVPQALQSYWQSKTPIERISHFSRARNEADGALSLLLSSFKA